MKRNFRTILITCVAVLILLSVLGFFFVNKDGYNYDTPAYVPVSNQTTTPAPSPEPVTPVSPKSVSVAISNGISKDYDASKCWEIYQETPQQKSIDTRLQEAKKCSHFSVFLPTYIPEGTHIDTGHTWWLPAGLNGDVRFSVLYDKKMPPSEYSNFSGEVVVNVGENTIRDINRVFPSPVDMKFIISVLNAGGNTQRAHELNIHDVKKITFSDGRTALTWGDLDSDLLYFELNSTSILLTVPGYKPILSDNTYSPLKKLISIAESFK